MSKIETISLEMIRSVINQYENMIKEPKSPHALKQTLQYWKEKEKDFHKKTNSKK
jgi:hypothetical protein